MSKYYYGFFRSTDTSKDPNGQLYKVVIITDFRNVDPYNIKDTHELTLSGQPFIVEYASDEENIYKPYKCSTATVSFYQEKFNYDFQTSAGTDIFVQLLKKKDDFNGNIESINTDKIGWDVEWCGFVTPNAYSQSYELQEDLFQLECQDGLSVLQYYKYERIGTGLVSFLDIILKYTLFLRCYKKIYISDSVYVPLTQQKNIMSVLNISERNFFDEDGEADDVLDILENIFLYSSLTCVPFGDALYILNYDAIRTDYNSFTSYVWTSSKDTTAFICEKRDDIKIENFAEGSIKLKHTKTIYKDDFASNGTNLSLIGTYNKSSVKCDLYPLSSDFPNYSDPKNSTKSLNYFINSKEMADSYPGVYDEGTGKYTNCLMRYLKLKNINTSGFITDIKFHWYPQDNMDYTYNYEEIDPKLLPFQDNVGTHGDIHTGDNFIYTTRYVGAGVVQYDYQETTDAKFDIMNFQEGHNIKYNTALAIFQNHPQEGNNYIQTGTVYEKNQKMITFSNPAITILGEDYIVISGTFKMFPNTHGTPCVNPKFNTNLDSRLCHVECYMRFGNLYYNGTDWTTEEKSFYLQLEYKENQKRYNTNIAVVDNLYTTNGSEKTISGFFVKPPINAEQIGIADFEFSICRPYACGYYTGNDKFTNRFCGLTLIENFNIRLTGTSEVIEERSKNDSNDEYIANTSQESVVDSPEYNLKISTFTHKRKNWSAVYYNVEGWQYLSVIGNKATGELGIPEIHILQNTISEYHKPVKVFVMNLHNSIGFKPYSLVQFTSTYFENYQSLYSIVDNQKIDYAANINTITLTQKL